MAKINCPWKQSLLEVGEKMGETAKNGLGAERGPLTLSRLSAQLTWLADFFPTVEPGSRLIRSKGPTKGWARIWTIDWDTQNQIKIALSY